MENPTLMATKTPLKGTQWHAQYHTLTEENS